MSTSNKTKIFIDGQHGTTGLQILDRLKDRPDIELLELPMADRKDLGKRAEIAKSADIAVLCLPDAAAKELVAALGDADTVVIDASTAHRVADGWTYGFPELAKDHRQKLLASNRISNPGCYPTGAIALLRPLVDAGLLPADTGVTVNAVSGYSGGGKPMIESYEATKTAPAFELYGLGLAHKHVLELQRYSGLTRRPIFVPSVGNFRQGMLVSVPLHLDTLPGKPKAADLEAALAKHYARSRLVKVVPVATGETRLEPEALNCTDQLELRVYANEKHRQAVLVARLDNLGKGASGAAAQNVALMLGLA
jgi:N-acetyl-gamma-glutamyl-phosphate reductase